MNEAGPVHDGSGLRLQGDTELHHEGGRQAHSFSKFVGLDVSHERIAVAPAERGTAPPRYLGSVPNTPEEIRKTVRRLGQAEELLSCYEAGPPAAGRNGCCWPDRGCDAWWSVCRSPHSGPTIR